MSGLFRQTGDHFEDYEQYNCHHEGVAYRGAERSGKVAAMVAANLKEARKH